MKGRRTGSDKLTCQDQIGRTIHRRIYVEKDHQLQDVKSTAMLTRETPTAPRIVGVNIVGWKPCVTLF